MFKKILIANRGEIAARVIRTCRDTNIATVAVYTPRDLGSLHVRLADEAMPLTSPKRYGDAEEILEIAQRVGADAIHPGYGFLAEEADLARACEAVGITFIGPLATVLEMLRAKAVCWSERRRLDSPPLPFPKSRLQRGTKRGCGSRRSVWVIPWPWKSACGGRGRGTRVVHTPEQLDEAFRQAGTEAERIYGDGCCIWSAFSPKRRHRRAGAGRSHGNVIHLGERSSSLQHQNQKLIADTRRRR